MALSHQNDYEEITRLVSQKISQLLNTELVLLMMVNPKTHQTVKTIHR
jgi:hypothetical protein